MEKTKIGESVAKALENAYSGFTVPVKRQQLSSAKLNPEGLLSGEYPASSSIMYAIFITTSPITLLNLFARLSVRDFALQILKEELTISEVYGNLKEQLFF